MVVKSKNNMLLRGGESSSRLYTRKSISNSRGSKRLDSFTTDKIGKSLLVFLEKIQIMYPKNNIQASKILILNKPMIKLVCLYILAALQNKLNRENRDKIIKLVKTTGQFNSNEIQLFIGILEALIPGLTNKYKFKYNPDSLSLFEFVTKYIYYIEPLCNLERYSRTEQLAVQNNLIQLIYVTFDSNSNIVTKLDDNDNNKILQNFFNDDDKYVKIARQLKGEKVIDAASRSSRNTRNSYSSSSRSRSYSSSYSSSRSSNYSRSGNSSSRSGNSRNSYSNSN